MAPCGGDSVYGASARSCVVLEDPLIWPQRLPPGAATRRCLPVEGWAASAARASLARARATSSLSTASLPTTRPMTRCRNATWAPAMNPYSPALAPTITKSRVTASKLFTRMRRARGDGQHVVVGVPRKRGPRHNHEALSRNSVDRLLGVLLDAVAGEVAQGMSLTGPSLLANAATLTVLRLKRVSRALVRSSAMAGMARPPYGRRRLNWGFDARL